ncbi:hypothetical protein AB0P15_38115 [Streptomyces sp. NPDC087917]|uniref:hypothetical protein n=1 Tax=unclassified Streptomyces TaxID=2593676 RepID=UPI00341FE2DC
MEIVEGELRRLRAGLGADSRGVRDFFVRVRFTADDAARVIGAARDVLASVIEQVGTWPEFERWPELLPAWFVQRCEPETVPDPSFDAVAWQRWWHGLTSQQKAAESEGPWMLSDWLSFFDPTEEGRGNDRSWWWWDSGVSEPGSGWVEVVTTGWPCETGSLAWLIEPSGGSDLSYGP